MSEHKIREDALKQKEIMEGYRKANLGALSIIGGNPYADVLGAWQDARGVVVKTFKKERESCEEAMRWYEGLKFSINANPYIDHGPSVDVRGAALIPKTEKKEPYCPRPEIESDEEPEIRGDMHYYSGLKKLDDAVSYYSNTLKRQDSEDIRLVNKFLNDFRKDRETMAAMFGGTIVARSAGVQPVFVTNWPDNSFQNMLSVIQTGASLFAIWGVANKTIGSAGGLRALLGLGATEAAGGAAAVSLLGPILKPLIAFGGGYVIGTGINKGLGAVLGIEDRPGTKWYEGGIGESVSDIFRRERIVRIENAPPEIKNQNKVNLLINLYEDGRSYVETDLNTEPKIDFRRGYMD